MLLNVIELNTVFLLIDWLNSRLIIQIHVWILHFIKVVVNDVVADVKFYVGLHVHSFLPILFNVSTVLKLFVLSLLHFLNSLLNQIKG